VVDAQVHIWDASPHNQAAPDGEVYALDLLRRHRELDGGAVPPLEVERVSEVGLNRDVFGDGCVDRAVLQPVVLGDLFVLGFSPLEWHAEMAGVMPDRFVLSGELDPDGGQPGARGLTPRVRRFDLRGITLCERRRPAGSMRLADPWLRRTLARCGAAGADVVHVGVGPSTRAAPWARAGDSVRIGARPAPRVGAWAGSVDGPLVGVPHDAVLWNRPVAPPPRRVPKVPAWAEPVRAGSAQPVRASAAARVAPPGFDARQFRDLALALPDIRFVLGAGCLPTAELARLAALSNVHVMLTEILPWTGSIEFAHAFGTLLRAFGAERLLFGSGYPMMRPGPLVRELAAYRFPDEVSRRYPRFDAAAARAVLGGNAARLYRIPVEPVAAAPAAAGA
jgi:predicted TIM-barrel fold metal-dependent hydrolase